MSEDNVIVRWKFVWEAVSIGPTEGFTLFCDQREQQSEKLFREKVTENAEKQGNCNNLVDLQCDIQYVAPLTFYTSKFLFQ